jgi:hypothetical protein
MYEHALHDMAATVDFSMRIWQTVKSFANVRESNAEALEGQGSVECTGRSMASSEATISRAASLDMQRNGTLGKTIANRLFWTRSIFMATFSEHTAFAMQFGALS